MTESCNTTGSAGIKGPQYEIRLALHFAIRAILNEYHSFSLRCNMGAAGKFDDVVFRYKKNECDQEKLRLVQAKNRVGRGCINSKQLLDPSKKGDLNLYKYFISYQQIVSSTL